SSLAAFLIRFESGEEMTSGSFMELEFSIRVSWSMRWSDGGRSVSESPIGVRAADRHHTPEQTQRPRTGSSGPLAVTEVTGQSRRDRSLKMTLLRRRRSSLR